MNWNTTEISASTTLFTQVFKCESLSNGTKKWNLQLTLKVNPLRASKILEEVFKI